MFVDWVIHGAEIGVVAFFAIAVFLMLSAVIVGLLGLGAKIFEDAEDKRNGGRA